MTLVHPKANPFPPTRWQALKAKLWCRNGHAEELVPPIPFPFATWRVQCCKCGRDLGMARDA